MKDAVFAGMTWKKKILLLFYNVLMCIIINAWKNGWEKRIFVLCVKDKSASINPNQIER